MLITKIEDVSAIDLAASIVAPNDRALRSLVTLFGAAAKWCAHEVDLDLDVSQRTEASGYYKDGLFLDYVLDTIKEGVKTGALQQADADGLAIKCKHIAQYTAAFR